MARDNTIALSDEEKEKLCQTRLNMFGTEEVPYGVVISKLCENED